MTTQNWNLPPGVTARMIDEQFGEDWHYEQCPQREDHTAECECHEIDREVVADWADREYDRRREEELFGV